MSNPNFTPPTTDAGWDAAIRAAGLHIKWHNEANRPAKYPVSQLQQMLDSHSRKRDNFAEVQGANDALAESLNMLSSAQRKKLKDSGALGVGKDEATYRVEKSAWRNKRWKLDEITQLLTNEIRLRESGFVVRQPVGTTYYIDADNGSDANDGLSSGSGNAWATWNKYISAARSGGDRAICRRGTTANYGTGTISYTSDGLQYAPIILEADYDDVWGDFAASAQTFTMVSGSKTHTASATITGISVGDWVYNSTDSDDPRMFAYEVAAVSGTTLTLHLPFKGTVGATKTLTVMPPNPVFGAGGSADVTILSSDRHWLLQGLHAYGDQTSGQLALNSSVYQIVIRDYIFQGAAASTVSVLFQAGSQAKIYKSRGYAYTAAGVNVNSGSNRVEMFDCLWNGTGGGIYGLSFSASGGLARCTDCEFLGHTTADIRTDIGTIKTEVYLRNCLLSSATKITVETDTVGEDTVVYSEDHNQVKGDNRVYGNFSTADADTPFMQTDTGTVRVGGSTTSIKVLPGPNVGDWDGGRFGLIGNTNASDEGWIPINLDTASRTFTVYFKTDDTANWTANPTASELFLEMRYFGHVTNKARVPKRSTGTVNFTGVTTWEALSLTVQAAQSGLAYFRVVYGKTKESAKSNEFFVDPLIVVS